MTFRRRFSYLLRSNAIGSLIVLLAIIARIVFCVQWHATPYGASPQLDALAYDQWAQDIAQGHLWHGRAFYQSPLFPYILGLLYAIFGHSLWIPSLFNAVIGAATCVLLSFITFEIFGAAAAIATGILAAFYTPFIFYTAPVMKEPLVLFLFTLFVFIAYRALKTNSLKLYIWSGICLGICAIARGNVLLLAPVVPCLLYFERKPLRFKHSAVFVLGIALAILPVTLHNAIASHDFVLLTYQGGFNAYIGHGPAATGTSYVFPSGVTSNPAEEEFDVARIAVADVGHPLQPSEVSGWWAKKALDYALENPRHEWRLLIDKVIAFWSNNEPFDNYNMPFIEKHFDMIVSWPLPCFGLIVGLAVFAVLLSRREQRNDIRFFLSLTFAYMLTLLPFYMTDRYRLPVLVFLLPLAGAAVPAAMRCFKEKQFRRLGMVAAAAIVVFGLTLWPVSADSKDEAFNWGTLCSIYEDQGYHIPAIWALDNAVVINPHNVGADAWIKTAEAMDHLGRRQEAEDLLENTTKSYPQDGSLWYNFGRMKFIDGDYAAAFAAFQKTIELTPTFALGYRGLAAIYDHYGDRPKAIDITRQGLAIDPSDPRLVEILNRFQSNP